MVERLKRCIIALIIIFLMIFNGACSNKEKSKDITKEASSSYETEASIENIANDIKYQIILGEENYNLSSLISIEDLRVLDKEELSILRNAIYAKYGYKFKASKYTKYFSQIKWYQPKYDDVSNMLTETDTKNIENIVEIEKTKEKSNEDGKVFETTIDGEDKNYSYKIEFFLQEDKKELTVQTFNKFKIYKINEDEMKMVFSSEDIDDENINEIISTSNTPNDILNITDKDKDGMDEIYLTLEDILGYKTILVIEYINDKYVPSFYGYEYEEVEYQDVNEDGVMELINDHPGGGGYVSTWKGLDLVNELKGEKYKFSFGLTKLYYENIKREMETKFETSPTPECFVRLLDTYADLGMSEKCTELINKQTELVNSTDYDYSKHNDSPAETFFDYVVARAHFYNSTWDEMKSWDVESEIEKANNTTKHEETQAPLAVIVMPSIPQLYKDFMKEKDPNNEIVFYAEEDIDLDGREEVIIASGTTDGSYIYSIYILRDNDGKIEQLGENLAQGGGYSVYNIKLIELQDMPKKYIYCGVTNDVSLRGFSLYELKDSKPNVICYSASPTGAGEDELRDFDGDGKFDGYVQRRWSYDVFFYIVTHTYGLENNDFVLKNTYVELAGYPDNIEDVLMQYIALRVLDNGKSTEIDKRLSELCIYDKANEMDFSKDVWNGALYETVMETDNAVKFDIEEKDNTATATAVYVDRDNKKYTHTFHLTKSDNKWCIDNIIR